VRHRRDTSEYSEFVEQRSHSLLRTAYLLVGDHQLAEDLLQEALIKTFIAGPGFATPPTSTPTRGGRSSRPRSAGADAAPSTNVRSTSCPKPRPGTRSRSWRRTGFWSHTCLPPPRQRAAIVLRYYEDLSAAQTAEIMG